jgi:hypothetical protein
MSNTSIAAPAICLFFNTLIKACSSTIGPREVLIKREVCFISPSSAAPTSSFVRPRNYARLSEQFIFRNQFRSRRFSNLWSHVLAPGMIFHPESKTNPRDLPVDIAKPNHSRNFAAKILAD